MSEAKKARITVIIQPGHPPFGGDVLASAYAESGELLACHVSSTLAFARIDIGLTSDRKHDIYRAHCPEGYVLVEAPSTPNQSEQ